MATSVSWLSRQVIIHSRKPAQLTRRPYMGELSRSELSGSAWEVQSDLCAAHGGSVRMFDVAAASGRYQRRAAGRSSAWTKEYQREVALADLGCAVVGVFVAAQPRFGNDVTRPYLALSLALPMLWIVALWLAGAYDLRFIGTGSDEFRKVLNASVSLTVTVAIFSYAINLELSRVYVVIALPSLTLFDMVARLAIRKRLHRKRMSGKCMHSVVVVKPGLTGLWQVNGRKTISVMLCGSGAH